VDLDEHAETEGAGLRGELFDEGEGLRRHERGRARRFDRVADGVHPHQRDPVPRQHLEDLGQVGAPLG
jgi:hypothetical protein